MIFTSIGPRQMGGIQSRKMSNPAYSPPPLFQLIRCAKVAQWQSQTGAHTVELM